MTIQPRKLILGLMLAANGQSVGAKDMVTACELFGVSQGSTRVALARLAAENLVQSTARGVYSLGKAAKNMGVEVSNWQNQLNYTRPWSGFYVVAYTNHMGRTNRTVLKQREHAFEVMGFREIEQGLFVRPDNIDQNLDGIKKRLVSLEMEPHCHLFLACEFQNYFKQDIHGLWNPAALLRSYTEQTKTLQNWLKNQPKLSIEVAAKESYLLGSQAIRAVRHDPLLPEELVDTQARAEFFDTVVKFDQVGKAIWQQFHEQTIQHSFSEQFMHAVND